MICLNLTIFRPKLLNVTTLKQMVCPKRLKRNYFSNFKYDLLKLNYFSSKSLKRNYFEADHYFSEIRHFSHLLESPLVTCTPACKICTSTQITGEANTYTGTASDRCKEV